MRNRRHYTQEEQAELLSNPNTFNVTECKVVFTLAFKKFVIAEHKKGTPIKKIFEKAGYREDIFSTNAKNKAVQSILKEAGSEQGLKTPQLSRSTVIKKHQATQISKLEKRIKILEQQLDFIKKTRYLAMTGELPPDDTD